MELQLIEGKPDLQLIPVNQNRVVSSTLVEDTVKSKPVYIPKPFIEANTTEVDLHHLKNNCIIPVFSKDNEKTIAHQEFIDIVLDCALKVFNHHVVDVPEIRVSHQIKGRTPDAIYKNVKDLLDHEKTIYYERMAFIIRISSIKDTIKGNEIALTISGASTYKE